MDIYQDAKLQGTYLALLTDPGGIFVLAFTKSVAEK